MISKESSDFDIEVLTFSENVSAFTVPSTNMRECLGSGSYRELITLSGLIVVNLVIS